MNLPNKKYKLVYVDPPWRYNNKYTGGSGSSGSFSKYDTMSLQEICEIPVQDITEKDAVCFLWITVPLLPDGFKVLSSWGFKYKTSIFWRKIMSLGMGYWFRGQVEVCLLGIKGNIKTFHCQKPNFIQSKVGKHSQKPHEMYSIIESLNLNPKIELFARQRREDWASYGNQVPNEIQTKLGGGDGKVGNR